MTDPLTHLLAFATASTRSWSRTVRTITLITTLLWLPLLTLALILTHSSTPLPALSATTSSTLLLTARILRPGKKNHQTRLNPPATDRRSGSAPAK